MTGPRQERIIAFVIRARLLAVLFLAAATSARAAEPCSGEAKLVNWAWTQDGTRPIAITFTLKTDKAETRRLTAIDFGFRYRGGGPGGITPQDQQVHNYVSTELFWLVPGENDVTRRIETGPALKGQAMLDAIGVISVACRAE